jgi:hypothetical protein
MQCRHDHTERKRETAWAAPFTAVLLCVIFLTFGCTGPSSYRWTELPQAQFPAQVNQIITEYGNLLDRRHRAGYGEWDVSAISEPPMATYTCLPHEACHIVVSKLHCVNAHSEKTECAVRLDVENKVCRLLLPERRQALAIRCPLDVVLAREQPGQGNEVKAPQSTTTAVASF